MLTAEEKIRLWGWVAGYAAPGKLLIAGAGVESVRETVWLANQAAGLGYRAALVVTPHYYKNLMSRPKSQALFFSAVADRSKIPILIYNFPQVTGLDIPVETVAQLSQHPNIAGIKESSGNVEKVARMVRDTQPGFQVLVGSAPALAASLEAGATGAILAYANAAPYSTIAIAEAHRGRDTEAARDWQQRITPAAQLVTSKYGIPGLKYAMDLNGYYGGPCRLPLAPPTTSAMREIAEAFRDLKG
jgi:4-hydroxy-2-oxoglutarate aldolase